MSLVPGNDQNLSRRSIEVTRTCLRRGQSVTQSLWVNIRPQNPFLKSIVAVPAAAIMMAMLMLIMITAGFTLLAVALMLASSGKPRKGNNR